MFEKLIEVLAALAAAIKENTAALSGAASAPAESGGKGRKKSGEAAAGTATTTTTTAPTVDDLRKAAGALIDLDQNASSALLTKLNAKHKTAKISEVPEGARAEVIADINAEIERVKSAKNAASQI